MSGIASPRVAVLSLRRIDRGPWLAQLMALEDLAVSVFNAEVIYALPPRGPITRAVAERGRVREWSGRMGIKSVTMSAGPPSVPFDLLLVFANDVQQVLTGVGDELHRLSKYARERCLYLSEVWPSEMSHQPRAFERVLGAFSHVFTSLESSVGPLQSQPGPEIHLLATSVDVTQMFPWPQGRPQIDVTALGRKAKPQHEALKAWAGRQNRFYFYDATAPGDVRSFAEHREAVGQSPRPLGGVDDQFRQVRRRAADWRDRRGRTEVL